MIIRRTFLTSALLALVTASAASGCASSSEELGTSEDELIGGRAGAVYTMSNAADANEVIVLRRAGNGTLQRAASYGTAGKGSADGLGSQGALSMSADRKWLFAVNAGSNELSTFAVSGESLYLVDVVATGGIRPISVTEHGGLVYVLHAGEGQNGIAGFRQRRDGTLSAIAGSTRALSAASVGPAQVSFTPSGGALIVTEKMTDKVDEFRLDASGRPGTLTAHASEGKTPFGFAVTQRGQVIVSEAFGGGAGAGAASSYQLFSGTGLEAVSSSVGNGEGAPCWVVLTRNDRYAYVSNTASGSISVYDVGRDGSLTLPTGRGRAGDTGTGSKPIDIALSKNDRFFYSLDSGTASVSAFRVAQNGSLTAVGATTGLPATAVGLAAQ